MMRRLLPLSRMLAPALGLALFTTTAPAARSQATEPAAVPAKLSLKEAITLAVGNNARHRQSYVSVLDARSRRRSAGELRRGSFDSAVTQTNSDRGGGSLDATVGSRYDISNTGGSSLALTGSLPWIGNGDRGGEVGVGMTMPLLRGRGRTSDARTAVDRADLSLRGQELNHFLNQQVLVQQVVSAYFNAVRATELVKVQQQAVQVTQQATDDAQKRLDAGLITEIDLTRAQLNLTQVKESLANQIQSQRNAVDDLVLLLGLPVGSMPELTEAVNFTPTSVELEPAIREALANRPEMEMFRIQKTEAEIDLKVAQDRKRPRADLTANLTNVGLSLLGGGGGIARVLTSVLGIRLNVPVSKTTLRENQAQAERQIEMVDRLNEFQRQQIVEEVRSLVRAAETAKSNIDLLSANTQVARRSLAIAQRLIEEGLADNRNFLDAQQSVTRTESSLLEAKVSYLLTMVSLRRALGQNLLKQFDVAPLQVPERPTFSTASTTREPEKKEERSRSRRDTRTSLR